jgi:hypothetical protein
VFCAEQLATKLKLERIVMLVGLIESLANNHSYSMYNNHKTGGNTNHSSSSYDFCCSSYSHTYNSSKFYGVVLPTNTKTHLVGSLLACLIVMRWWAPQHVINSRIIIERTSH